MAPKKKSNKKVNKDEVTDMSIMQMLAEKEINKVNIWNNHLDEWNGLPKAVSDVGNPAHSEKLLEGLKFMQNEKFLCDFTLVTKTKSFEVHKVVVASCSEYIRSVLRKDPMLQKVEVNDVSAVGMAGVVTYAYTGRLGLSLATVGSVLSSATRLQVSSLLKMCCDYLMKELNVENCLHVANIARAFDLHNTKDVAEKFLRENFVDFSETEEFLKLSFDQINQFLQDDTLEINSELTAFHIALKWLEHDDKRLKFSGDLLSNIRFSTISAHDLVTYVQTVPRMMQDHDCHKLLVDAMNYHLLPYQQNTLQSRRTKLRGGLKVLVTVGGRSALTEKSLNRDVLYRDPEMGWGKLTEMVAKSFNQCVAVMDGFLYVAGGEDQNDARNQAKHAVSTVCRYDPRFNNWIQLASMSQRRTHFSMSALNGQLYAIGGRNLEGPLLAVESYVPAVNQWQPKAALDVARCCHASAVSDGNILVTGGYISNAYSRTVCGYDPSTDRWQERASLSTPRGWHCSVSLGERVFVVGGSQLGPRGERVDVLTVEAFNPFSSQWSYMAPLAIGVSTAGATLLNHRLYVCGGWNEGEKKYKKCIQVFDAENNEWAEEDELCDAVVGVSCCALLMPRRGLRESRASSASSVPLSI
ncbi:kelch-like protein 31 [Lampetra fluviatilis]